MLIEFYGRECGHCKNMESLVARAERELGVTFERYETWHDEDNELMRQKYDTVECGGVPMFVNTDTNAIVCGEVPYEEFYEWASGGKRPAQTGFTLLEMLLVVAAIALLAGIVIVAINPQRQLSDTRDAQRSVDVDTILTATYQYALDHNRALPATIPVSDDCTDAQAEICRTESDDCSGLVDLSVLTDQSRYLLTIPVDPLVASGSAGTGYGIVRTAGNRLTVCAPLAEGPAAIDSSR